MRGIDATSFCIGRFPIDGSTPEVFSIDPGRDFIDVEDAVVLDDVLWFAGMRSRDRGKLPANYGLFRLDPSAGVGNADVERVARGVAAVGVIDDSLIVGRIKNTLVGARPCSIRPGSAMG
jgi:hypothetical protein